MESRNPIKLIETPLRPKTADFSEREGHYLLSTSYSEDLNVLLNQNAEVFENQETSNNVYTHEIVLTDESKFVRKTYPIPVHYQQKIDLEINNVLTNNIEERLPSNFVNPVVIVKKKNNGLCLCLRIRNLIVLRKTIRWHSHRHRR